MSILDRFSPARVERKQLEQEKLALYGALNLQASAPKEAFVPVFWVAPRLHREMADVGHGGFGAMDAICAVARLKEKGFIIELERELILPPGTEDCYQKVNPNRITRAGMIACAGAYEYDSVFNARMALNIPAKVHTQLKEVLADPSVLTDPAASFLLPNHR